MWIHFLGVTMLFLIAYHAFPSYRDDPAKAFVRDQSKEALNFQITVLLAMIAAGVLSVASFGLLSFLPVAVVIVNAAMCIVAGVNAGKGAHYRYPITLRPFR